MDWGESVIAMAEAVPIYRVAGAELCQFMGPMNSKRAPESECCTIQIAARLGARSFTLHAAGLISSAELAKRLQEAPSTKIQFERLQALDLTVSSTGDV